MTEWRVASSQNQLEAVIEGWKTMSLDQKQKVCTSLSACTRVVGTEAPKLTADLDKMPFSEAGVVRPGGSLSPLKRPCSSRRAASRRDVFGKRKLQGSVGPSVALYVHPAGAGRGQRLREGRRFEVCDASEEGINCGKQYVGGYGLRAPIIFTRPEKEALAAVLSSDLELKNGQLALKVRASPRPDLAALVAPKTAADTGLKLRPSLGLRSRW